MLLSNPINVKIDVVYVFVEGPPRVQIQGNSTRLGFVMFLCINDEVPNVNKEDLIFLKDSHSDHFQVC